MQINMLAEFNVLSLLDDVPSIACLLFSPEVQHTKRLDCMKNLCNANQHVRRIKKICLFLLDELHCVSCLLFSLSSQNPVRNFSYLISV